MNIVTHMQERNATRTDIDSIPNPHVAMNEYPNPPWNTVAYEWDATYQEGTPQWYAQRLARHALRIGLQYATRDKQTEAINAMALYRQQHNATHEGNTMHALQRDTQRNAIAPASNESVKTPLPIASNATPIASSNGKEQKKERGSKYMTPGTDEEHQGKSEPVLKRGYRPFKARSVAWYNPKDGHILHDDGSKAIVEPYSPLVTILSHIHSRVLYLLPDEGGSFPGRLWYLETVKSGYTLKKYLSKTKAATITGEGLTVDIYPVDQYFDNPPSLTACRAAHLKLTEMLQATFRSEYALVMGTASYTGSNLLIMSLPRERTDEGMKAREYKTLPQDIRDTVIGNSGQGRIETFSPKQETIDQLYEIDGVFMYAACLRDVPTGPVTHDESNEYAGYTSGFYRIIATVPETWQHIGLLPFYDKIASRKGRDVHTVYPNVPGTQFETWATHHELRLAYEHNWTIDIKERLLWTERSSDPLRTWGEKLKTLREAANELPEPVRSMLRSAIRSIVLKAIGGFHRHEIKWDGYKPLIDWNEGQGIDNIDTFGSEGDTVHYQQSAQFTGQQLTMLHPEWTMDIWGKSRVKIARAALSLPYESIIALRTDGIWCTEKPAPVGIWEETGKPGSWRVKYSVTGPIAWPKNNAEMVTLIQTVKKQGKVG